jgi:putative MATE family efflux protein
MAVPEVSKSPLQNWEQPVWRRVLALGIPALAQQYLFFLIQQYDQFLARRFSPDHQAALTTANYLYWFVSSYSVIVGAGATALVGRCVGAKDFPLANRATGQALLLALTFGLFGSTMGLLGMPWLLNALQLQGNSPQIAMEYLYPLVAILALQMLETGGIACFVGAGDTRTGLMVLVGVTLVNVPAAWFLSERYGFVGIAMGTAIAHGLGGLTILTLLVRGRSGLKLPFRHLLPDRALLIRLLRVSVPAAMDSLSVACCQLWFLSIVNRLGNEEAAAHGIAIRLEALGYLAGGAFGPAAMAVVSQSLGANRPDRAMRGGWAAYLQAAALMSFMGVVFFTFAEPMCRVYSPENPRVVELAVSALKIIAFAMPGVAAWSIFTAALRAAGDSRMPLLFSWLGFLGVRIPLAYWLTPQFGLTGAWVAMTADIYVRGSLFVWRFASGKWQKIQV